MKPLMTGGFEDMSIHLANNFFGTTDEHDLTGIGITLVTNHCDYNTHNFPSLEGSAMSVKTKNRISFSSNATFFF